MCICVHSLPLKHECVRVSQISLQCSSFNRSGGIEICLLDIWYRMHSFRQCPLFQSGYIANIYMGIVAGFPIPSGGFKGEPLNTLQAINKTLLMGIPDSYCILQVRTNVC